MKKGYIYKITNLTNNKVYIGQTIDFNKRKQEHINALKAKRHRNIHLQSAWEKYGQDSFKFDLLETLTDCTNDELTFREQYWIDYYGGLNSKNTYNKREAGNSGTFSEEVRQRICESVRGRTTSEETKEKLRQANLGRHHTEETKQKISTSMKGYPGNNLGKSLSEETKQKISEALKGRPAHNRGISPSEETRQKISFKLKGKPKPPITEEARRKMSAASKGRPAWNKGKLSPTAKNVAQYTIEGTLVAIYHSARVAEKETNINCGNISRCCNGSIKTAGGFKWHYVTNNI